MLRSRTLPHTLQVLAAPECLRPVQGTEYRWEFYPAWQQLSFDSDELIGTSLGKFEGEAAYTNTDHFDGYYSSNGGILVTKVVSVWRPPLWSGFERRLLSRWLISCSPPPGPQVQLEDLQRGRSDRLVRH